jgi:UDP-glucose 4-epimerase
MKLTQNLTILITGGTGSFGVAFLEKLLSLKIKEIRIFSRDEKKQSDLKLLYPHSFIKWFIGDVRDRDSLMDALNGVDIVFHAAALKQVPTLENFPLEATKTNVIGTDNVLSVAIQQGVKHIVVLSTDKSVHPVSAMGLTKSLMEKTVLAKARLYKSPIINIVRYGNVLASRGSVIPLFIDSIKKNIPITLHNPESTRFLITIQEAIELVLLAIESGKQGEIFVPKIQSASLSMIVKSLENLLNQTAKLKLSSLRQGDKLHEQLIDEDEYAYTTLEKGVYIIDGFKTHSNSLNAIKPFYSNHVLMSQTSLNQILEKIIKTYQG